MKIFIIGPTGSGKSTLANNLSKRLHWPVISAGGWIRDILEEFTHSPAVAQKLSRASEKVLKYDPLFCVKWIKSILSGYYDYTKNVIIEGIRSPADFEELWESEDLILWLSGNPLSKFEKEGLESISKLIETKDALALYNPSVKRVLDVLNIK